MGFLSIALEHVIRERAQTGRGEASAEGSSGRLQYGSGHCGASRSCEMEGVLLKVTSWITAHEGFGPHY